VICRGGATTLAELAASAAPAVIIPYPHATDDHQRLNALPLVAAGAARMIDERTISGRLDNEIAAAIVDLLTDSAKRQAMSAAMHELARPDAAWQVAMMVYDLVIRRSMRNVA
jgi:UDP-N-acetylglucosamine--N-acetylmuramyl-(pentapeptide) pyrophosphoryl-undecaprenol N-acetylglucosamine transferase